MTPRRSAKPAAIDSPASCASIETPRAAPRIPPLRRARFLPDACLRESFELSRSPPTRSRMAAAARDQCRHRSTEIVHLSRFISIVHQRAQPAACAEQPRLDRGRTRAGDAREVAVAPIVLAHQQYEFALVGWQLGQRALDLREPPVLKSARGRRDLAVMLLPRNKESAPSATP